VFTLILIVSIILVFGATFTYLNYEDKFSESKRFIISWAAAGLWAIGFGILVGISGLR
jgi:hypothetical protein